MAAYIERYIKFSRLPEMFRDQLAGLGVVPVQARVVSSIDRGGTDRSPRFQIVRSLLIVGTIYIRVGR